MSDEGPQAGGGGGAKLLFIAGMGRSGTTLLEKALGAHPRIVVLGEVWHLWKRGLLLDETCGCGHRFSGCKFWTAVGERAFGGWDQLDVQAVLRLRDRLDRVRRLPVLTRANLGAAQAADLQAYVSTYARLYRAAAELTGAQVVVDSSKQISLAFCLSHVPDLDLRVVHAVRDSRAVSYAWSKVVDRPEAHGEMRQMPRYSAGYVAAKYDLHNAAVDLLGRRAVPVRRLRYEDFVSAPDREVRGLASFAGVGPEDFPHGALGPSWVDGDVLHTVSGNPVRFASGRIPVRRDDVWLTRMPRGRKAFVTAATWPLLLRYGYPVRPSGAGELTRR